MNEFATIKNARLEGGLLSGTGYALADYESLGSEQLQFTLQLDRRAPVSFVFGFQGVGHHYRLDFHPATDLVIFHLIHDGIPVYLQHASIRIETGHEFTINWSIDAIRIFVDNTCFLNVTGAYIPGGRWGFAAEGKPERLPTVAMKRLPSPAYRQVVLGDGYSNNRWKNRHFFSWPELAFGHRGDYLNACVAAGNTRRVLDMINSIRDQLAGAEVLIAAGADDFIEGELIKDSLDRLKQVITAARTANARTIRLCAIPPRARNNEQVIERNRAIAALASASADGFIDFHSALGGETSNLIVNGDYPGAEAQQILARTVLSSLGIDTDLANIRHSPRPKAPPRLVTRFLHRLARKIDPILDRLPTPGVS